ncbi:MAG TPA: hypothetical protein VI729_06560 [Anaerolineales bacterium]|nr:hypothetical protein [Anaerolineales bacterium]
MPDELTPGEQAVLEAHKARAAAEINAMRQARSGRDLAPQYVQEMLRARGRGAAVGRQIREKYQRMGLNVAQVVIGSRGHGAVKLEWDGAEEIDVPAE